MNIETIRQEALSLPPEERAQLAEQLLSSLDALSEAEIEQLWFQEAAGRATELDQGLAERRTSRGAGTAQVNYYFHQNARAEHLEHVAYYELKLSGLGTRYLAAFDSAMLKARRLDRA